MTDHGLAAPPRSFRSGEPEDDWRDEGQHRKSSLLRRGLDLLTCFQPGEEALSLSTMARRVDLPLPTAHRIIQSLCQWGLLERCDKGLRLGWRLLILAHPTPMRPRLWLTALPHLETLHLATQSQVRLVIRYGNQTLQLGRIERYQKGLLVRHEIAPSSPLEIDLAKRAIAVVGERRHGPPAAVTAATEATRGSRSFDSILTVRSGCVVSTNGRLAAAAVPHPDPSFAVVLTLRGASRVEVLPFLPLLRSVTDAMGARLSGWSEAADASASVPAAMLERLDQAAARRAQQRVIRPERQQSMLDKGVRLLTCFDDDQPVLTAARLSAVSNLAKSTTHRLIGEMSQRQILTLDRSGVTIGTTLRSLSTRVPGHRWLVETARPRLAEVRRMTGGDTYLALVNRPHVIWMEWVSSCSRRDPPSSGHAAFLWQAVTERAVQVHDCAAAAADRWSVTHPRTAYTVVAVAVPVEGAPQISIVATLRRRPQGNVSPVVELLQRAASEIAGALSGPDPGIRRF